MEMFYGTHGRLPIGPIGRAGAENPTAGRTTHPRPQNVNNAPFYVGHFLDGDRLQEMP